MKLKAKQKIVMENGFPLQGEEINAILDDIDQICSDDYAYENGRVLNSICTYPLPIAILAYMKTIDSNLGDNRIYKGIGEIEKETTRMLGDLLGNPNAVGNAVSGGTEANLLAMLVARNKRKDIQNPEVLLPLSAHFSFDKVAELLGLKLTYIPLDELTLKADVNKIEELINENTIALVGTAGTSEFGTVDPLEKMAKIAEDHYLFFHIDAASGGFILPFARELGYDVPCCDFSIGDVNSITIDPHKYGMSVIPSGYILFKNREEQKFINFSSHYVGTHDHTTLTGTRTGAGVVSCYAVIKHLGREGFKKITRQYYENKEYLIRLLRERGLESAYYSDLNIVSIKSADATKALTMLEGKKWLASLSRRYSVLRIVLALHVKKEHLNEFVNDLAEVEQWINRENNQ